MQTLANVVQIADLAQHEGQEVTVRGWLYNRTDKGKLQFLLIRDGSGIVQCVAFKKELDEDTFTAASTLGQESSVMLTGTVRKDERAPGVPGGYEVGVKSPEVIQNVE